VHLPEQLQCSVQMLTNQPRSVSSLCMAAPANQPTRGSLITVAPTGYRGRPCHEHSLFSLLEMTVPVADVTLARNELLQTPSFGQPSLCGQQSRMLLTTSAPRLWMAAAGTPGRALKVTSTPRETLPLGAPVRRRSKNRRRRA
jgi:hypothetical protein